jgi:hypothetical protein
MSLQAMEMPKGITAEDVWAMLRETALQQKESNRKFREMSAETGRKFQDAAFHLKETQRIVGGLGKARRLDKADIDEQVRRMEKVRRYASLRGDGRRFFCAVTALTASDNVIEYTLAKGFYLIMPSGEDVKITEPVSGLGVW